MSSRVRKCKSCLSETVATATRGLVTITRAELARTINPIAYVQAWMRMCTACPSSQRHTGVLWCGTPMVDQSDHPDPSRRTCGCLCRAKGRVVGAECPQGKHVNLTVKGSP